MVSKLGRRANNGDSAIAIPPPLPPSVEEAYRRKCIQLKRRTNEVEEDNEAARLRLVRLRRGVEKLRLERAFLLDQLAKRTSTNVEDSDGSPSPPPTVRDEAYQHNGSPARLPAHSPSPAPAPPLRASPSATTTTSTTGHRSRHKKPKPLRSAAGSASAPGTNSLLPDRQQPQDKPLRSKRGHRKPSIVAALESGAPGPPPTFINQSVHNLSPSSEAFSQNATGTGGDAASSSQPPKEGSAQRANGESGESSSSATNKTAKKTDGAFELYAAENRAAALESKKDDVTVDEELAQRWKELPQSQKDEYTAKDKETTAEKPESEAKPEEPAAAAPATAAATTAESQAEDTPAPDDDVDMEHDE